MVGFIVVKFSVNLGFDGHRGGVRSARPIGFSDVDDFTGKLALMRGRICPGSKNQRGQPSILPAGRLFFPELELPKKQQVTFSLKKCSPLSILASVDNLSSRPGIKIPFVVESVQGLGNLARKALVHVGIDRVRLGGRMTGRGHREPVFDACL